MDYSILFMLNSIAANGNDISIYDKMVRGDTNQGEG